MATGFVIYSILGLVIAGVLLGCLMRRLDKQEHAVVMQVGRYFIDEGQVWITLGHLSRRRDGVAGFPAVRISKREARGIAWSINDCLPSLAFGYSLRARVVSAEHAGRRFRLDLPLYDRVNEVRAHGVLLETDAASGEKTYGLITDH